MFLVPLRRALARRLFPAGWRATSGGWDDRALEHPRHQSFGPQPPHGDKPEHQVERQHCRQHGRRGTRPQEVKRRYCQLHSLRRILHYRLRGMEVVAGGDYREKQHHDAGQRNQGLAARNLRQPGRPAPASRKRHQGNRGNGQPNQIQQKFHEGCRFSLQPAFGSSQSTSTSERRINRIFNSGIARLRLAQFIRKPL